MTEKKLADFILGKLVDLKDYEWKMITTYWENDESGDVALDTYQNILYQIEGVNNVKAGCSKVCIFFDEMPNYVFKIPFRGCALKYYCEDEDCFFNQFEYDWSSYHKYSLANNNNRFQLENEFDYCEAEEFVYNVAVKWGIEDCFARTFKVAEYNGVPIYASERVKYPRFDITYAQGISGNSREKARELSREYGFSALGEDKLTSFVDFYGVDKIIKLILFLKNYRISDLHNDNVGFNDKQPVVLDYSSFDCDDICF